MSGSPLFALMETACNRALALDPERDRILAELSGRSLDVYVTGPVASDFRLGFLSDKVVIGVPDAEQPADAELSGTPATLLGLVRGGGLPGAEGVSVRGNLAFLGQVSDAMGKLRPDWHEPLSRLLGDSLGHPVARGLEQGFALFTRALRELHLDTAEYLREESGLLAEDAEVRAFCDEVDRVRDAVARLERRVVLLESGR